MLIQTTLSGLLAHSTDCVCPALGRRCSSVTLFLWRTRNKQLSHSAQSSSVSNRSELSCWCKGWFGDIVVSSISNGRQSCDGHIASLIYDQTESTVLLSDYKYNHMPCTKHTNTRSKAKTHTGIHTELTSDKQFWHSSQLESLRKALDLMWEAFVSIIQYFSHEPLLSIPALSVCALATFCASFPHKNIWGGQNGDSVMDAAASQQESPEFESVWSLHVFPSSPWVSTRCSNYLSWDKIWRLHELQIARWCECECESACLSYYVYACR